MVISRDSSDYLLKILAFPFRLYVTSLSGIDKQYLARCELQKNKGINVFSCQVTSPVLRYKLQHDLRGFVH